MSISALLAGISLCSGPSPTPTPIVIAPAAPVAAVAMICPVLGSESSTALPSLGLSVQGLLLEPKDVVHVKIGVVNCGNQPATIPDGWLNLVEVKLLRGTDRIQGENEREDPEFAAQLRSLLHARAEEVSLTLVGQNRGGLLGPGAEVSTTIHFTAPRPGLYQLYAWIPPGAFSDASQHDHDGRLSDPLPVAVEKTIAPGRRAELLFREASRQVTRDDVRALELLDSAVALRPDEGATHRLRGFVLARLHRPEQAAVALEEALRLFRLGKVSPQWIGWEEQIPWIERSLQDLREGRDLSF